MEQKILRALECADFEDIWADAFDMYPEESMEDSNFESYAVMYDSHRDELFILNYASGGTTYADIATPQS